MTDMLDALSAPFPPAAISWRVGSTTKDKSKGMALAFIDARDVMKRLDEACGPANWQRRYPWSDGKRLYCEIGIKLDGEWVWKGDGAGDSDVEAEKGAFSDAFKRAAVSWGVGRYLYDVESPWVALTPAGNSFRIADQEQSRLQSILAKGATKPQQRPQDAPKPPPHDPETGEVKPTPTAAESQARAIQAANAIASDFDKAKTDKALAAIKANNAKVVSRLFEVGGSPLEIYQRALRRTEERLNVTMAG